MFWINILDTGLSWFFVLFCGGFLVVALLFIKLILGGPEAGKEKENSPEACDSQYPEPEIIQNEYDENSHHVA